MEKQLLTHVNIISVLSSMQQITIRGGFGSLYSPSQNMALFFTNLHFMLTCAAPFNSTAVHYYLSTNNLVNHDRIAPSNSATCENLIGVSDGKL